jgi:hypothetical protein
MNKHHSESDQTTKNRLRLIKLVKSRLSSSGKAKSADESGNVIYVDCDIFSLEMLNDFLTLSLSDFNQTPYFTFFGFDDADFVNIFAEVLVEGAVLQALASKALIERGREFQISDCGINFEPPSVSELMQTQYSVLIGHHFEKLKNIKNDIKAFGPKKKK